MMALGGAPCFGGGCKVRCALSNRGHFPAGKLLSAARRLQLCYNYGPLAPQRFVYYCAWIYLPGPHIYLLRQSPRLRAVVQCAVEPQCHLSIQKVPSPSPSWCSPSRSPGFFIAALKLETSILAPCIRAEDLWS